MGSVSRTIQKAGLVALLVATFGTHALAQTREGVAAGSLQLYPGLRIEAGVDSNPLFQSTEDEPGAGASLVVNPYLGVRTPDPRMLELQADLGAAWEQLFAIGGDAGASRDASDQSGLDLDAVIGARINPRGLLSVAPETALSWATRPSLTLSGDPHRVLHNRFELGVGFHPGGHGRKERTGFTGEAALTHRIWRYDEIPEFDRQAVGGRLNVQWNFLPRTGLFIDAGAESTGYERSTTTATTVTGEQEIDNVDSLALRGSLGFTGLLTRRFSITASGGYGVGNYDSGADVRTYLAHVELGVHVSPRTQLALGWQHNFEDAVLSNYFLIHRTYADLRARFGAASLGARAYAHFNQYAIPQRDGDEVNVYNGERLDTVVGGTLEAQYSVTRWLTLGVRYNPSIRDSTATYTDARAEPISSDYVQHRALFTVDIAAASPLPLAGVSGSPRSITVR
jgi:hypothetical protein